MPLTLLNTLVLFFEKALCNGSSDASVVARRFLEVEVSREVVVNEGDEGILREHLVLFCLAMIHKPQHEFVISNSLGKIV